MQIRRNILFSGAAVIGTPLLLASCPQQIQQFQVQWTQFIDQVNAIVSRGCGTLPGFVATAQTIEAIVSALYPAASAAIAAGAAGVQAVAGAICNAVPAAPPAQLSARLRAAPFGSAGAFVGNTVVAGKTIPVRGYGAH